MKRNQPQGNSAPIPSDATLCDIATDPKAAKALANVESKYPHVVPGSIWKDARGFGVLIRCTTEGCSAERWIHTSDAFQVKHCLDHRGGKAATAAAVEEAPAGVRSKGGRKAGRKAPKAGKGKGKARKGRSGLASAVAEIKARASSRKGE